MQGAVLYGPRDVRFEERDVPNISQRTDAIIRISAACVCGSDLWPVSRHPADRSANPDGPRILRHCRGGRKCRHVG